MRKLGQTTLRSIGHIGRLQSINDNDEAFVSPWAMLKELETDNGAMAQAMRKTHELCDDNSDAGTAGLLETFIDEMESRAWFLFEAGRGADGSGH